MKVPLVRWESLSKRVKLLTVYTFEFVIWKGQNCLLDILPSFSFKGWNIARSNVKPFIDPMPHIVQEGKYQGVILRKFALSASRRKP